MKTKKLRLKLKEKMKLRDKKKLKKRIRKEVDLKCIKKTCMIKNKKVKENSKVLDQELQLQKIEEVKLKKLVK